MVGKSYLALDTTAGNTNKPGCYWCIWGHH